MNFPSVPHIKFDIETLRAEGFQSQDGQDKYVAEVLFPALRAATFVDIGAHDGVRFSNTYYLEKTLGWSGLAVEPIAAVYQEMAKNRNCITINGCVSDVNGTEEFVELIGYGRMLSGLKHKYDQRHIQRIQRVIEQHGTTLRSSFVPCYTLEALLHLHNISLIHYLSLDIEGGELDVLKSINYKKAYIKTIGVENNYGDPHLIWFMKSVGYQHIAKVGADEFFMREDHPA